jgi:hypothetical protein
MSEEAGFWGQALHMRQQAFFLHFKNVHSYWIYECTANRFCVLEAV